MFSNSKVLMCHLSFNSKIVKFLKSIKIVIFTVLKWKKLNEDLDLDYCDLNACNNFYQNKVTYRTFEL